MSLVKYQTKQYDESLNHCAQTLKINEKNLKAIFRKAIIFFDRDLYEECQQVKFTYYFIIIEEY